jgi:DMSO reductase family type II enzyme chaperone
MVAQIQADQGSACSPQQVAGNSARQRAAVYAVLAQAISVPRRALCEAVEQGILPAVIEQALHSLPPRYVRGLDFSFLDKLAPAGGNAAFADVLLAEYTRLFALNLHCPQYEADYVSRNSFNWAQVISAVTGMYSNFGVQLASDVGERPDHIAIELDFMNLLAGKEARVRALKQVSRIKVCRKAQKLFFSSHLSRWAVLFARRLRQETRLDFYRALADLMEGFLRAEARYWSIELQAEVQPDPADHNRPGSRAADCDCSRGVQESQVLTQLVPQTQVPVQPIAGGKD